MGVFDLRKILSMLRSGGGNGVTWRLERLLPWLGSAGSTFGGLAVMCCIGWTGLASLLPTLGLGFLVYTANAERLIYVALNFSGLGFGLSWRRHRRPWSFIVAAIGAGLLLYPFHHALEVTLWVGLVYAGLALLFSASVLDAWLAHRATRYCTLSPNRRHAQAETQFTKGVKSL